MAPRYAAAMDTPPPLANRPRFPAELAAERAELEAMFTATPMYAVLGITLEDWGPGWARLAMTPDEALGNLAGTVHGGATFTLADAAFEVACNSYGRLSVALETTCHYHRPATTGSRLVADGWELSRGGRTATYRLSVSDDEGRVLVSYLALAYRTDRWHLAQKRFGPGWG